MSKKEKDTQYMLDGDGTLVAYDNPFGTVTQQEAQDATKLEHTILTLKHDVESRYEALSTLLDLFEDGQLYKARGYENFKAWADSPEIDIGYRTAQDLIRIKRQLVPMLQGLGIDEVEQKLSALGTSKTRALLPMLREDHDTIDDMGDLLEAGKNLTVKDFKEEIKRIRNYGKDLDEKHDVVFKATAWLSTKNKKSYYGVHVVAIRGDETYGVTDGAPLTIDKDDWPKWEKFFGKYIEYRD